jgi:hypothetical protein
MSMSYAESTFIFGTISNPAKTDPPKESKQSKRMNSHPEKQRIGRIPDPLRRNRHPAGEQ